LVSVTVAYFGGQSRRSGSTTRLALTYVLGIAVSFSMLGSVAALSGGLFGSALQQPAVIILIAGVLIVLALGSFGFYQFRPPAVLMQRAGGASKGGIGALLMGLTMGVVAAPCVGPIVIGLLVFVGSRQDPVLGFLLFFVLALGMGAPYVVLAVAAGKIRDLPRSGEWLVWTERLFGCILLCLAAYFVAPLLPYPLRQYLLPSAIVLAGLYLGFLEPAGRGVPGFAALRWSVALVFLGFAAWLVSPGGDRPAVAWESVAALHASGDRNNDGRPVVIDFGADWCIPCREMDRTTYVHPGVVREAQRFRMVKVDLTRESDGNSKLVDKYGVRGVPTIVVLSGQGEERQRMVGYVGPAEMLAAMKATR
jgi:thiol:disulfide interchange protein DsbD